MPLGNPRIKTVNIYFLYLGSYSIPYFSIDYVGFVGHHVNLTLESNKITNLRVDKNGYIENIDEIVNNYNKNMPENILNVIKNTIFIRNSKMNEFKIQYYTSRIINHDMYDPRDVIITNNNSNNFTIHHKNYVVDTSATLCGKKLKFELVKHKIGFSYYEITFKCKKNIFSKYQKYTLKLLNNNLEQFLLRINSI